MKKMMMIAGLLAASMTVQTTAQASVKSKKVAKAQSAAPAVAKKNVSRDIRFNGSQVDGKYLSAGESIAEVESDKEMGALIGIRKNFRDRLNEEKMKLQANSSQTATSGKGQ